MTSQKEPSLSYTPPISLSPVFQSLLASRSPTDPYPTLHLCSGKNLLLISENSNSSTSTATHQPSSVSVSFNQSPTRSIPGRDLPFARLLPTLTHPNAFHALLFYPASYY